MQLLCTDLLSLTSLPTKDHIVLHFADLMTPFSGMNLNLVQLNIHRGQTKRGKLQKQITLRHHWIFQDKKLCKQKGMYLQSSSKDNCLQRSCQVCSTTIESARKKHGWTKNQFKLQTNHYQIYQVTVCLLSGESNKTQHYHIDNNVPHLTWKETKDLRSVLSNTTWMIPPKRKQTED